LLGKQIVEAVLKLSEEQTSAVRLGCSKKLADALIAHYPAAAGEHDTSRVFEIYRKFDLRISRSGQNSSPADLISESEGLVQDLVREFERAPKDVLKAFVNDSLALYVNQRALLFAARNRESHVAAVFRPFQQRYFNLFTSDGVSAADVARYKATQVDLLNFECNSYLDLRNWWDSVWDFFIAVAVKKSTSDDVRSPGMIGTGSVRTYRQQWYSWYKNYSSLILEPQIPSESRDALPLDEKQMVVRESQPISDGLNTSTEITYPDAQKGSKSELALAIATTVGSTTVSRRWAGSTFPESQDLEAWCTSMAAFLQHENGTMCHTVDASLGSKSISFSFDSKGPKEIANQTLELLALLA